MFDGNDRIDDNNESDGFSFESILAEVKGSAFINGDKRTPPDLLQEKADRILREAAEMTVSAPENTSAYAPAASYAPGYTTASVPHQTISSATYNTTAPGPVPPDITESYGMTPDGIQQATEINEPFGGFDSFHSDSEPDFSDTDEIPMIISPLESDAPQERGEEAFGSFEATMNTASSRPVQISDESVFNSPTMIIAGKENDKPQMGDQDTIVHNIDGSDTRNLGYEEEPVSSSKWGFGRRNRSVMFDQDTFRDAADEQETEYTPEGDEIYEEPQLKDAVGNFTRACNSISLRILPASVITLLMVIITYVFEAGLAVPFGIEYSLDHAAGTLVICLLIVMMLCSDVIVRGVDFLVRGVPNAETLILFSCIFSIISAAFTILSGAATMLPFCAVSALSLTFAAHGEKYSLRAMAETLKTATGSSEPYGIQAEFNSEIDKSILKKAYNRTDGFYTNLIQPDITEIAYRYAAPVLLVGALLLTVIVVLVSGSVENSLHILSALLAAAAPFSALLSFSVPFSTVAKTARKSGASIAGWGGADDICFVDGVCVTDDDLFPPGMLKLSGVKVYDGASPENAIRYTASLIMSSGSGLTNLFSEVLKQQGLSSMRVDDFECHESGIGALIRGEHVSTGSAAFMNLLGVRVPDDTNMKNAVYTAVNNRLVAMFAIDYKPLPSVQSALISMLKWRIDLYFAMRDFNVTPAMVGQKFKVPFDSFVFIPAKDSYSISDLHSDKEGRMAAVLVREGLNPFAEAITGGRLLKSAALFATILSVVSAALGVLIMFYMCWTNSFQSASPGNLVIFMLCMLATVLIVCGYVRLKK